MVGFVLTTVFLVQVFTKVAGEGYRDTYSIYGMMLESHIIKTLSTSISLECLRACKDDDRCQSFNYVMVQNICELNNASKESRPEFFVRSPDRYYITVKFLLGSFPEMPADSWAAIVASEDGKAVSGSYWLKINNNSEGMASKTFPVYCDMTTGSKAWTLIARFSNNDVVQWMNGYWWYDRTEAVGKTIDPFANADMISPAFWLASGNEFKITRSDDSLHTPLLQTTGNCLGGQTFRTKITSYGDFSNGKKWSLNQCLGNCKVKYGGQYSTTEGFIKAGVNGTMQSFNRIGFWCHWGWSGTVMMIGGGGQGNAGHGLGVTAGNQPNFVNNRPKKDFANDAWESSTRQYALNLWIRS
ncbi:hypothetical protein ACROYT_G030171 [Oculina patagonica]